MPVANSHITSGFGGRADPMGGGGEFHKGIDFKASTGDPVMAVADGVVSFAGVRPVTATGRNRPRQRSTSTRYAQ